MGKKSQVMKNIIKENWLKRKNLKNEMQRNKYDKREGRICREK